jgi:hypothetical protein
VIGLRKLARSLYIYNKIAREAEFTLIFLDIEPHAHTEIRTGDRLLLTHSCD